jgi:basic amino acid/polyamine antiporter, APA family
VTGAAAGEPSRLARRLGTGDAVVVGVGAMLGAGVFAAFGPAAEAAGPAMLVGLALAAAVAWCNATSSAQLAAVHPQSGGTYVYGRARLGRVWGVLAGWAFVSGKTASCAAMALTFGAYAAPSMARPLAIAAVVAVTAVNLAGVSKTVRATAAILAVVLASLATVVVASLFGGSVDVDHLGGPTLGLADAGLRGVLQSGALVFFAFAGYARIATLGEEVRDPGRTIPRAVPVALGIVLTVYAAVAVSALLAAGADVLAAAEAPLAAAVSAGDLDGLVWVVRAGATMASLGVLVALLAGVGRTTFAMAGDGELPRWLAAVHPRTRVPHRAELAVAAVIVAVVAVSDVRGAIGFSSANVLVYYAIANASALRLQPSERRWPRWFAAAGVGGCLLLAASLPLASMLAGVAVLAGGMAAWAVSNRLRAPSSA